MTIAGTTADRVRFVIGTVFNCDPTTVMDHMGPTDIAGWDSLGNVTLVGELQREFQQELPIDDLIEVETVGDIIALVSRLEAEPRS